MTTGRQPGIVLRMIDQETRRLALQTFKDVLTATDSKAADRLRAAEGVMKLEAEEKDKGMSDVLDADDAELLNRARGTHGKTQNGLPDPDDPAQ